MNYVYVKIDKADLSYSTMFKSSYLYFQKRTSLAVTITQESVNIRAAAAAGWFPDLHIHFPIHIQGFVDAAFPLWALQSWIIRTSTAVQCNTHFQFSCICVCIYIEICINFFFCVSWPTTVPPPPPPRRPGRSKRLLRVPDSHWPSI